MPVVGDLHEHRAIVILCDRQTMHDKLSAAIEGVRVAAPTFDLTRAEAKLVRALAGWPPPCPTSASRAPHASLTCTLSPSPPAHRCSPVATDDAGSGWW